MASVLVDRSFAEHTVANEPVQPCTQCDYTMRGTQYHPRVFFARHFPFRKDKRYNVGMCVCLG